MSDFINRVMRNTEILNENKANHIFESLILESDSNPKITFFLKNNFKKIQNIVKHKDIKGFYHILRLLPKTSKEETDKFANKLIPNYKRNLPNTLKIADKYFSDMKSEYKEVIARLLALAPQNKLDEIISKANIQVNKITKGDVAKIIMRLIIITLLVLSTLWYSHLATLFGSNVMAITVVLAVVLHILAIIDIFRQSKYKDIINDL